MRKIISFSLYGDNPIYTIGCIRNAELKTCYFKDWEMWVYHNDSVPIAVLDRLAELGVILVNTKKDEGFFGSMWRFMAAQADGDGYFISRDCDSRISLRDEISVNEWISSGRDFHIIRDHPVGHGWVMNAGMWGCRLGVVKDMPQMVTNYVSTNNRPSDKSIDQCFLRDVIYPIACGSLLLHDEYFNYEGYGKPINLPRTYDDFAFIGESVDENDIPRGDQRAPIRTR